jgi:hypothetical protein
MGDQGHCRIDRLDDDGDAACRNLRGLQGLQDGGRQAVGLGVQRDGEEGKGKEAGKKSGEHQKTGK